MNHLDLSTKQYIRFLIQEILNKQSISLPYIPIEYSETEEYGDYATPIAMSLAGILKKNPRTIAEELYSELHTYPIFEKIDIAGPGYLNFFLSKEYLKNKFEQIISEQAFGQNTSLQGQSILLEYISANPTGPLHIGHARWAAVGDSLARLLKFCGATVFREFYVNDAGVQIAHLRASVNACLENKEIPEDGYHGTYIKDLAEQCKKTNLPPEIIMQSMQAETLKKFRTEFDNWFSEKSLYKNHSVESVIEYLKKKDSVYQLDGALWFKSTEYSKDDKDRVLIKSDGSYTYLASDIAYHYNKLSRGYSTLINILGFDHHGYVERISAAVKVLGGKLSIILGQMVNLLRHGQPVRMSKRTGDIITLDEVIDEIGTDAARYLLTRRPMNSTVDFDLETAKSANDDNPVFYIQYAHARICSVLQNSKQSPEFSTFSDIIERRLILEMIKFEDILLEIAQTHEIHKLPNYLENLAGHFHKFYKACRIIDQPEEKSRLAVCCAARNIIHTGLDLLGVSAPEYMEKIS
ncbi:MAG: arginine--tRNA ligase [Brevinemataceae bacterium]